LENQQHRANGLNLVVAAIVLWNTVYLERLVNNASHIEKEAELMNKRR
jgi:TnpA family transposase